MRKNLVKFRNALLSALRQTVDCVCLSLFWGLCSLPLVTVGASSAALYDAVYYGCRRGEKHAWRRFFRSFRNNLKPGILPGILYLLIFCTGAWGIVQIWNTVQWEQVSFAMFSGAAFIVVLLLGILSIMFPVLSRFNNSFGGLLRNTVLLGLANLPRTVGLGFVNALSILLCAKLLFPLLFLPALANLIGTLFLEPMFKPYMGEDTQEEKSEGSGKQLEK